MIFYIMNASIVKVAGIPEEKQALWDLLSYSVPTRLPQYGGKFTYVKKSEFDRRSNSFGYGLLNFVTRKLDEQEINYEVRLQTKSKELDYKDKVIFKNIELEDYQKRILKELVNFKRGIIEAPTAAGKSIVIAGIIKNFHIPRTLVVVPTTDIARNTIRELEKVLRIPIGLVGDGSKEFKKVTVILYQSLAQIKNIEPLNEVTDLLIVDEVHLANESIEKILKQFTNVWYRYGLSATPISPAKKKEWFTITSQIGEKFITVTDKQAEKRVTNVECYMIPFRGKVTSNVYLESYRPDVILNPNRNTLISKIVWWIFHNKKANNVLVLVDEYQQALMIQKYLKSLRSINSTIIYSGLTTNETESIKKDFCNNKIKVIIATPRLAVGSNLPEAECLILGSARKSNTNTLQRVGRIRRKIAGKDIALLFDLYDVIGLNDKYFQKFSEQRLSLYKRKKWFQGFLDID